MKINAAVWLCALALLVGRGEAYAQGGQQRVSLLPKVSLGGQRTAQETLENALAAALAANGARIVDLERATQAERLAWSDRVQAGKLPEGANLFFTDAFYSAQLTCWQSAEKLLGTSLLTVQCSLDSKIVRADSGDVVFTDSQRLTAHGLKAETALDELIRTRLGERLEPLAARALAQLQSSDSWSLDLVVSELGDTALAHHFADVLEHLPGVSAARMALYRAGDVKYVIEGRGAPELAAFPQALEGSRDLALSLFFQSPRLLHARFDLARALPRPIMVLGVVQQPQAAPGHELALLRAGLSLLPYLEPAHSSPVLADIRGEAAALQRVARRASGLAVPLILQLTLLKEDAHWFASSALIEVASKRSLLQSSGSSGTPEAALSQALQGLDQLYRSGLGKPALQSALGISRHVSSAPSKGVVVDAFRLVQRGGRSVASLKLHNLGPALASELSAKVRSDRQLLAQLALGPLSAGSALEHEIPLQALPQGGPELRLEVDYQLGDERRQAASQLLAAGAAPPAPLWEGMAPAYYEMVLTARRQYDAGEWQEARRLFQIVYAANPNARIASALGFVELDLRNLKAARKYLEESLTSTVRPLTAEQREEVMRALRRIP